jgi:leucyl aminopeptidase (aminopeptidase T)
MPGVTEDMLARVMAVDFDTMAARSQAVAAVLDRGAQAHLTCPRGSDATFDLSGRYGLADDGDLTASSATSRAARGSSLRLQAKAASSPRAWGPWE